MTAVLVTNSSRLSLLLDTLAIGTLCPYCLLLTSLIFNLYKPIRGEVYLYLSKCSGFLLGVFGSFVYQFITLRLDILVHGGVNVVT